jgi:hypothetical protein
MFRMCRLLSLLAMVLAAIVPATAAEEAEPAPGPRPAPPPPAAARGLRSQDFTSDPRWDSHRSRLLPSEPRATRQDFGHRSTSRAGGKEPGEIGGWVQRSITPAYYAKVIPEKSLNDKLTVTGRFAVHEDNSNTGTLLGWFNADSRGWRTPNSLAMRIDGNGGKYWVFFEYGTRNRRTGGGATFEGRYQTTRTKPLQGDGTSHRWSLTYDPKGNNGDGELVFTLDGVEYKQPLAPGHRADGATFNRFGLWNQQTSGDAMDVYLDDLTIDGREEDLTDDPGWEGKGNDVEFADTAFRPFHDFGYSKTKHAGGKGPGEVGGLVWRDEAPAYYAARTGPLSLDRELHASGKLAMTSAGADSAVWLGWFDSATKKNKKEPEHKTPQPNLLAVLIEGPSRAGHYFRPVYRTAKGEGKAQDEGPLVQPGDRVYEWSLAYYPDRAGGNGQIVVTFDGKRHTLDLAPGHRKQGARFDRFGLCNVQSGGHHVVIYLDDVAFTAR